ncbi:Crp/Fnr family transcriptional regulator [Bradyrhizobium liaoningense]|uniref:Crp/Fnr family transcriptional regulator n=1 Tax=Bradyrhizobium liaoningense TaxID=43992 RepID=UPI001BACD6BA|nr:Crp/Fnr family transcriptional regulator [Bradyrhizobium liaoningense]MBR1170178.1 Crp/Fnr family transcriptional regulator [Bradyrhizobium liaoningense]
MYEVRNRLLRLLPPDELKHVLLLSEEVPLTKRQVLHRYGARMQHVYFIESGLVSVGAKVGPQKFVEVWLIGSEGLAGIHLALTAKMQPMNRRIVQVAGAANRLTVARFQEAIAHLPTFRSVVHAYIASVLIQTAQSGACNTSHQLQQRLGRWLLLARNALGSNEIPLTHQVLAQLLGVRRAGVTDCLLQLKKNGLVEMMRGRLVICDAFRLAQISCQCWSLIEREYERQLLKTCTSNSES